MKPNKPFLDKSVEKRVPTCTYRLYMSGDYLKAKEVLVESCSLQGACFSITPTDYIYSGGQEQGFTVTLISYPRFPKTKKMLWEEVSTLAVLLMIRLGQGSFTIEGPSETVFYSRRKEDA